MRLAVEHIQERHLTGRAQELHGPFPSPFNALSGFTRPLPVAFSALLIVFSALLTSPDISNGGGSDESEMQSTQNFIGQTEAGLSVENRALSDFGAPT